MAWTDKVELVRRLFLRPIAEILRRGYQTAAAELLLTLAPARLLAVLRQTRRRSRRDWLDETDGGRLESAAAALEAVYRPRQARPLWERLATSYAVMATWEQRERAQAALERISP